MERIPSWPANRLWSANRVPYTPGEVLQEDFLKPLGMTANALAKALNVPTLRINDVVRRRRGSANSASFRTNVTGHFPGS
jgi:addiction module HigA family antidote